MILGFYYHTPVKKNISKVYLPGYLTVFIEELAKRAEKLYLFSHTETTVPDASDIELKSDNIEIVDMGVKRPAWYRILFAEKYMKLIADKIQLCNHVIVRAPSPLAPYFFSMFRNGPAKISFMIVGDYISSAENLNQPFYKKLPIQLLLKKNDKDLNNALVHSLVMVNSKALYKKYIQTCPALHEIKTTTLTENDFYYREDTCGGDVINLLYTGRFDLTKGLIELVEATAQLSANGHNVVLNLVGWEDKPDKPVEQELKNLAAKHEIGNRVIFHGKKKIGDELNAMYRMADIFVLPSYYEGFPRTLWEAMANSLPIIVTEVGGIPYVLNNKEEALLIKPKSTKDVEKGIITILENPDLRQKMIKRAMQLAKENTVPVQVEKLFDILKSH